MEAGAAASEWKCFDGVGFSFGMLLHLLSTAKELNCLLCGAGYIRGDEKFQC